MSHNMLERKASEFEQLNKEEQEFLLTIPVAITFLVAGSDNEIDTKERDWAERLIEFRASRNDSDLVSYYNDVERDWETIFQQMAARVTDCEDMEARNKFLSDEIAKANPYLARLSRGLGSKLYQSYCSFARQIAMASGGLLGFGAISPAENKWVHLKMLKDPAEK